LKKSEIHKLDLIWSPIIKDKSIGKEGINERHCECCLYRESEGAWLNAAHIVGRTARNTRWGIQLDDGYDLNGICLCKNCHDQYDEHRQKEEFIRRVVIGEERYTRLREAKEVIAKYQDYKQIKEILENYGH
jgi:hypothetical protein